ncbi:beta-N-acetylhexosaminidase [Vibrio maerlii]|uniref:beta-N-acetylhexosaminidase n=1 Tax=Vibrio maerlii TaxID=2231648 RepID=UPI000E3EBD34|nr:beta-N-acetylhexosaminidase [Vibrio maerlii]
MSLRLNLEVLSESFENEYGGPCRFGLTLNNLSDDHLNDWSLHFALDRFITPGSITEGKLDQVGSYCVVTPNNNHLKANEHFYCEFTMNTAPLRFHSDGFDDAFVEVNANGNPLRLPVMIAPPVLASPHKQRSSIPSTEPAAMAIIPKPNNIVHLSEQAIELSILEIRLSTNKAKLATNWFKDQASSTFQHLSFGNSDTRLTFIEKKSLTPSSYQLRTSMIDIEISAADEQGFLHACATLLQLIGQGEQSVSIPHLNIDDAPRYSYRGMMLDCARHFHPVETIKRLINQLAYYKFNTFHWHLTDDEGWRVEIKAFPQLTKIGAWRGGEQVLEPQFTHLAESYGGFYNQQEIKEIIEYAQCRGITVIPEFDIPGHCRAAIKALPELLVDQDDLSQYRSIQHYNDNVLSPGIAGTYQFIDTVLEEIAALFPSPYVHIGADEVPKGVWVDSPSCQQLMQQHGYQDPKELQGHLLRHVENKLRSLGKRMLGWEEAQHGNKVSKDTVIYSWLSEQAAIDCAKQGFDVVLQPAQFTYLDMTQDFAPEEPGVDWANVIPLEHAYRYEPLAQLADNDPIHKRVWGVQCALWCEIVNNQDRIDYMLYPRITAIAEACWTQSKHKDYSNYLARLKTHTEWFDKQGIQYRQPWNCDA